MNIKLKTLTASIALTLSASAWADINDIVISRYVMGFGNSKAIEILNTSDTTAHTFENTALYTVGATNAGGPLFDQADVLNGRTLPPRQSLVIYHAGSTDDLKNALDPNAMTVTHSLQFNGDDKVFIAPIMTTDADTAVANIHDVVGLVQLVPGQNNSTNGWGYRRTFHRLPDATPQKEYRSTDWHEYQPFTYEGLGDRTLYGEDAADLPEPEPVPGVCELSTAERKTIRQIQGEGESSPYVDNGFWSSKPYKVTGVIAQYSQGVGDWRGVYLQDKHAGDGKGSDGIFVRMDTSGMTPNFIGKEICFEAHVQEYWGMTRLLASGVPNNFISEYDVVSENNPVRITPLQINDSDYVGEGDERRLDFSRTLERHEGMLIKLPDDVNPDQDGKQDMRVSRTFTFDFGSFRQNMVLAYERVNMQPNQLHVAGSEESQEAAKENQRRRLFVESDRSARDGEIPYFPAFKDKPNQNVILVNDSVMDITGMLVFTRDEYRLVIPESDTSVTSKNFKRNDIRRTSHPEYKIEVDGKLETLKLNKIPENGNQNSIGQHRYQRHDQGHFPLVLGSKNVLNYFNSPFGGDPNRHGNNRGAFDMEEFELQQAKVVEALYRMDADIVGLLEMENNGFGTRSAIAQLVDELNKKYTRDRYSHRFYRDSIQNRYSFIAIDSNNDLVFDHHDHVGTDAITNAIIYRPSRVTLTDSQVIRLPNQNAPSITDPKTGEVFIDSQGRPLSSGRAFQRDALTATFLVHNTGKQLTVSANHLKSKGSNCIDDWDGVDVASFSPGDSLPDSDFQGQCENFRVAAAYELGKQLDKIPGDKVILGDLNSYAMEDPMLVLTENPTNKAVYAGRYTYIGDRPQFSDLSGKRIDRTFGYINAVPYKDVKFERPKSWSYSFNDELGSLDHALISPSLRNRLVDAIDWRINSIESPLFDYSKQNNGRPHKGSHWQNFHHNNNGQMTVTHYRSSDHDPVLLVLDYKVAERESLRGQQRPVLLTINNSRIDVPLLMPETAKEGDKVMIQFDGLREPQLARIPQPTLSKDGQQVVDVSLFGIPAGDDYALHMHLVRGEANQVVDNSRVSFPVEVRRQQGLQPERVIPEYDRTGGSAGSAGLFGLMLIGLAGWFRRRR
ncbi:ExeM/NucH family extracellular endonuclease [Vibrio metschnikovii]|uniref:ExeM/NucH family extracellular endonuclease n=1 Tax=Vibrio metschnikovii TaxID=28172 RepID=UPI0029869C5E|nr:ExeM/NucH family extracellular endonuclease [Vibrio metschnikovii]EKO3620592.1 ExeM/NucH family extracellular endonuclease [Vibrio metschnikovii]EKO3623806.1 ExeM/NucH family extracellular endonuclease [Vibrio metschnikovii]EKO3637289.1 ExeM/NucH family extracellular endonuclease [Vibrio metschnikovii]EKO3700904.1 ExeM/NucH family extracellular endonuclease [Vibrio metschnikovii]